MEIKILFTTGHVKLLINIKMFRTCPDGLKNSVNIIHFLRVLRDSVFIF